MTKSTFRESNVGKQSSPLITTLVPAWPTISVSILVRCVTSSHPACMVIVAGVLVGLDDGVRVGVDVLDGVPVGVDVGVLVEVAVAVGV